MNSRAKGARGERQWRDELRANGYQARRGQQFSGSPESPDVVCEGLPWAHFEVKAVQRLNIYDAMAQALGDCGRGAPAGQPKIPLVAHRRNHGRWLVTMEAETFFRLVRGDFCPEAHPTISAADVCPQPATRTEAPTRTE
jgi:Holliday junction resolvase